MSCTDSALDLLMRGNEDREPPFLNRIWSPLLGAAFGFGTGCVINFSTRRPLLSGIQKHIVGIALFTTAFTILEKHRAQYFVERDAVLKHYVQLHPEDFPMPERKKIGDLFEPWLPIR